MKTTDTNEDSELKSILRDPLRELAETYPWLEEALWFLGVGSIVFFVASLAAVPFILGRLPEDVLVRPFRRPRTAGQWIRMLVRNLVGLALIPAGVAMLVLPGQGLLTIAIGVLLIDGPAKKRALRWMFRRPAIRSFVDGVREKRGQPPLIVDAPPRSGH